MTQLVITSNFPAIAVKFGLAAAISETVQQTEGLKIAATLGAIAAPAIQGETPVLTGALKASAGHEEDTAGALSYSQIYENAQSDSGYMYARAREAGHRLRNGVWWEPPEQPHYAEAGLIAAGPAMDAAMTAEAERIGAKIVAPLKG